MCIYCLMQLNVTWQETKKWISCNRAQCLTGRCSRCLESFRGGEKNIPTSFSSCFCYCFFLFRVRTNVNEYEMSYQLQSPAFEFRNIGLRVGFWVGCSNTLGLEYKQAQELLQKGIRFLRTLVKKNVVIQCEISF